MEKLVPLHHLHPPLQNPLTHKPIKTPTSKLYLDSHSSDDSNVITSLTSVKMMHAQMIKLPQKWNPDAAAKNLISSYLEFGDFWSAAMVFYVGLPRNYLKWNSFVEEFKSSAGSLHIVLEVFKELHGKGVVFDSEVYSVALKTCTRVMDIWLGMEIHGCLIKRGFDLDVYLRCALMNFYGRCWGLEKANQVFHEMPNPEALLWNEAIILNLQSEKLQKGVELFRKMQFSFLKAETATIVRVLQACGKMGALNAAKQIHGYVFRFGLDSDVSLCNPLISMYSKNGKLELARRVFDSMENRNTSSWNSMISSYAALGFLNDAWSLFYELESSDMKPDIVTWNCLLSGHFLHGYKEEVLNILQRMQGEGFKPNSSSMTSVLQAISELGFLNMGKETHGYVLRNGFDCDVYVGTSLVDMYVKNHSLTSAQAVFDNMKNRNIFAWNSLVSGYSFKGMFEDALRLLNQMEKEGIKPDLVTWNGMISGYAMWGCGKEALAVLHQTKSLGLTPNVVSWTALISGSSQAGNNRDSLKFFAQMQQEGVMPNSASITCLLRACASLSLLQKGKEIHCLSIRNGFIEDVFVATALIDMYSKSSSLKNAHKVFRRIQNKTLASWNCMIMGFAIFGLGKEAISVFNEMQKAGVGPDAITFTALLSACKNSGLIGEGWKYFDSMITDYSIVPRLEHYCCMVDLLGRAGYLDEAWDLIHTMPLKPDATIWGALLGSCRIHKNLEFAETAAKNLFKLEPNNSANYILMMNLYSIFNRWEDMDRLRELMGAAGVRNRQVWSWIQINQRVHVFSSDGKPHPDAGKIYFELYQLVSEMKKLGYVPDVNCVYQNMDEVEKQKILLSHTEKLAITYGLIKMKAGEPIRIIKNTRICSDCHSAAKYISLVKARELFLRDGVRFHHFREGKCSCNDFW
ncbi:pentatricopeptide repeat-containing protein At4g01030, mitochondrial [Vitis riparia]|uniref:pentatricopeptide repeat-containing protein At4g01030, mitochondrial n=1 Tax=Vitis riparia TaxID=96939 RepID=UPI00155B26AB|nr:pentatricopeptide repeat-containing protein At4g01030, mitochondrial [Vitis riparia]